MHLMVHVMDCTNRVCMCTQRRAERRRRAWEAKYHSHSPHCAVTRYVPGSSGWQEW